MENPTTLDQLDAWIDALAPSILPEQLREVARKLGVKVPRTVAGRADLLVRWLGPLLSEHLQRMGADVQYLQGMDPQQLRTEADQLPTLPGDPWDLVQRVRSELIGPLDRSWERLVRLHAGLGAPLFEGVLLGLRVPKDDAKALVKLLKDRVQFTTEMFEVLAARHRADLLTAFEQYVSSPRARVYLMRAPGSALLKSAPSNTFAALVEFFQVHDPSVRAEMLLRMHLYIQTGWARHDLADAKSPKGAVAAWRMQLQAFESGSHDPMLLRNALSTRLKEIFLKATVVNTGSKHRTAGARTFALQLPMQPWDLGVDGIAPTGVIDALCPSVDGKVLHVGFASSLPFLDQKDQWQRHTMALHEQLSARRLGAKVRSLRVQVVCSAPMGAPMGKYQAPGIEIARNMSRNGMSTAPVLGMASFINTLLEAPHLMGVAHLHVFGLQLIGSDNAWRRGIPNTAGAHQVHANVQFCAVRIAQILETALAHGFAPFDYTVYRNDTTTLGRMIGTMLRLVDALKNLYLAYRQGSDGAHPMALQALRHACAKAQVFIERTQSDQERTHDPTARMAFSAPLQWLQGQLGAQVQQPS